MGCNTCNPGYITLTHLGQSLGGPNGLSRMQFRGRRDRGLATSAHRPVGVYRIKQKLTGPVTTLKGQARQTDFLVCFFQNVGWVSLVGLLVHLTFCPCPRWFFFVWPCLVTFSKFFEPPPTSSNPLDHSYTPPFPFSSQSKLKLASRLSQDRKRS